jgi:hypothetical protein
VNGLDWQKLEVSFSKGLNQKTNAQLVDAPDLVRAIDVEFDDLGGLRLRYPYASIGANIFGGGTISNCRRIYAYGNELVLFTDTALYSWSPQLSAWVLKGTHLAIKVEEESTFINTSNQDDCDRAQVSNVVVYCWRQTITGVDEVFVAAQDASTGAVLLAPIDVGPALRPRVVAMPITGVFVLFYENGTGSLVARTINATTLAISGTTTVLAAASFNSYYDVDKDPTTDACLVVCRRDVTTSYEIIKVTATLSLTNSTKARTCDGPIAVAFTTSSSNAQIVRVNGINIVGDYINAGTLADVTNNQALGSGAAAITQVTAAYSDATTCHVFWHSAQTSAATDWDSDHNTVTTANVIGTAATLIRRLGIASRAFAYGGAAYVWMVFAGTSSFSGASPSAFRAQLQNTYFLYRHDGLLCGKAVWSRAAGFRTAGSLPNVQLTSGSTSFSFCGGERRVIELGANQTGYADTGPRDITITFDSNDARRCARLGQTMYIAGGSEVLQYDGRSIVEVGFHLYPWNFGSIEVPAGNLADGVYTLKPSWRYDNAKGERERSTSATTGQVTIAAGPNGITTSSFIPLYTTHKSGVTAESWRTAVAGSTFYKTTSSDPTATSNPNRFVEDDPTAGFNAQLNDELADTDLLTKEPHPENGDELENLAPPSATLIVASADRLFLAGIPGEPNKIAYSKLRNEGSIAAFHDALTVLLPSSTGAITGLAFLNETLVAFCETAIYKIDGSGYSNTSEGTNFVPQLIASDIGAVSHEAIALIPAGLMFKSRKGWFVLNRGFAVDTRLGAGYVGASVADYDSETVYAAHVVETQHQVRIVTSGRVLAYDYLVDAWSEWSVADGLHACMWNGTHHVLATAAVRGQSTSYASADYGWDVEMLLHLGGLQGFARVRKILLLGEVRGSGSVRFRVGTYQESTYFDDKTWTISPTTAGTELEVKHGPSQQQHKAIRVRLTSHATAGEKPKLTALSLELGLKRGLYPRNAAAQRQ